MLASPDPRRPRSQAARVLATAVALVASLHAAGAAPARAQTTVPLCPGLTIVGGVSEPEGDYEPIVTVDAVSATGSVDLTYATQVRAGAAIRNVRARRTVLARDMRSAGFLVHWFAGGAPRTMPGTTAIGTSAAVLRALNTTGAAELGLVDRGNSALPANRDVHPNLFDYERKYTLRRVGGPVPVPVLVNGVATTLPAIRARGEGVGEEVEFLFLDDERNPMQLGFSMRGGSDGGTLHSAAVKISFRCAAPSAAAAPAPPGRLERELAERGRAEVYDVYFDFNSDRIREQSERTLREISDVLRRHPEWKLTVEGHTDDVAGDAYNLALSERRAAAVTRALTDRFAIAGGRLAAAGYGESRPVDRNDTLEGRARNRRVELVRQQ